MTPEEMYLTDRLDVQIAHFLKKSVQHRRRYKVLKITEIVAGFLIAVFCAVPMPGDRYRLISVALSSLGLLCEGILNLYNAKEHWISYQKTAQLLERKIPLSMPNREICRKNQDFCPICQDMRRSYLRGNQPVGKYPVKRSGS